MAACYLGLALLAILLIRFPSEIDPDKLLATIAMKKKKEREAKGLPPEEAAHASYLPPEKECHSM